MSAGTAEVSRHAARLYRRRNRARHGGVIGAVAGAIGELFVTLAVLLGLFFVWQSWWTDVQAANQAADVMTQFHDALTLPTPSAGELRTDDPPPFEPVQYGQTIGVLIVPRWDGLTRNAMPILEGTGQAILDQAAAGHYMTSQQVGEVGNFALAGHRRTHGNSFRHVDDLRYGDPVIVETATTWYVYEVTSHELVLPSQWQVIAPVPNHPDAVPTERLLTLTTCHSPTHGEYGNSHRWVTHATFAGWMSRADGTPEQILTME